MSSFQFLKRGAAISILAALLCSAPAAAAASRGGSQASLQSRPMTNSILSIRERNEHALSSHPPTTHSKKNGIIGRKTDILRGGNGKADSNNALVQALAGTVVFAAIEKAVKLGLQAANVQYPAQLGACILLFAFMALLDVASPAAAQGLFVFLSPGAALLAKWFPVLFVPGLAMLPLSPSIGGTVDILKVVLTVIVGFVFSMTTTLFSVTTVRSLQGRSVPATTNAGPRSTAPAAASKGPPGSPFSEQQWNFSRKAFVLTGLMSVTATKTQSSLASPLQMIFTLFATVASYIWGTRLPAGFVKLVHPLVTSSVVVLGLIKGLATVTDRDFLSILASYKAGTLNPLQAGAGDYLLYVLGPGVVAFAVSVYGRKNLLFRNLPMVLTAMLVSSAGGLFATGAFVRLIQLGGKTGASSSLVRLSVLARNVTMALAMALTDMIGGNVSIMAMVVCMTGIIGASYGVPLLNAMGVHDPICRGLGMGSSAQGLGVAAIASEPDAFAFASVAMIMTAVSATTLVSFPAIRNALIQTATGLAP